MKRFTSVTFPGSGLLAAVMLMGVICAQAQSIRIIENLTTEDGTTYQPVVQAISDNHRYVAGPALSMETYAMGAFVYDTETGAFAVLPAVDDYGADINAVTDSGVAIGYNGQAVQLSIADGTPKYFESEDPTVITQARDASEDLSVMAGDHYGSAFMTTACVWRNGKMEDLPVPTDEELGFETNGSQARFTNSDGSIIVGYVVGNFCNAMLVWRLQDNGTYVCEPVCTKFFSEWGDLEGRPYNNFDPQALSSNGKYVSLNLSVVDETAEQFIGRYNLETGELETYRSDGLGDITAANAELQATGVSDGGTIIGWWAAGSWGPQKRNSIIWNKGDDAPSLLANVCSNVPEIATYDDIGFNTSVAITPDGRYIAGFAYDQGRNYVSYVIDLEDKTSGITGVTAGGSNAVETARYSLDGTRLSAPAKGINIIKMSDGTTKKVVVE